MVSHIAPSKVLLTAFSAPGRAGLSLRALEVSALLRGEVCTRSCGELTEVILSPGGFVEYDCLNRCIWAYDNVNLRCWDDCTFRPRFVLGPWNAETRPNLRFDLGFVGTLRTMQEGTLVEVKLHSSQDGALLAAREVNLPMPAPAGTTEDGGSQAAEIVFLEVHGGCALMKRRGGEALAVDILGDGSSCIIKGTKDWEPEVFLFLQRQHILLALIHGSVQIWRLVVGRPSCPLNTKLAPLTCQQIGRIRLPQDCGLTSLGLDYQLATLLAVRRPDDPRPARWASAWPDQKDGEDLMLMDLLNGGGPRAALHGVCSGIGGGGVSHLYFDQAQGLLLLLGRRGGLSAYSTQ